MRRNARFYIKCAAFGLALSASMLGGFYLSLQRQPTRLSTEVIILSPPTNYVVPSATVVCPEGERWVELTVLDRPLETCAPDPYASGPAR